MGRKLLAASLGFAAIGYVQACGSTTTSGNLMAWPDDAATDTAPDAPVTSGNLMLAMLAMLVMQATPARTPGETKSRDPSRFLDRAWSREEAI